MGDLITAAPGGRATQSPGPSRFLSWLGTAALVCGVLAAALMLVPALLGYERYVISGDSMSGTYDRGSILYSEVAQATDLARGDVITYDPPGAAGGGGLVTHRIISIEQRPSGIAARTKGDANQTRDPGMVELEGPQARAVASIPYAGYAFAALGIREVRMTVIGVPAALIAIFLLVGLWRDAGRELQAASSREAAAAEGEAP